MPKRLQIEPVPDELMMAMKRRALDEGKTLREWVIGRLEQCIKELGASEVPR